jgi:hypothetical protein
MASAELNEVTFKATGSFEKSQSPLWAWLQNFHRKQERFYGNFYYSPSRPGQISLRTGLVVMAIIMHMQNMVER